MELFVGLETPLTLAFVLAVAVFAGVVKGLVGFAMPTVLISGMTLVLAPDLALAALILPTLVTNAWQALRQGPQAALQTMRRYRVFLLFGLVTMNVSGQLVRVLDPRILYALIGLPVGLFAVLQLVGWWPRMAARSEKVEAMVGGFAGFIGGLSGVWGPPTVAYLTAVNTPKQEQIRAQGVIFGMGALALVVIHMQTGVLRAEVMPLTFAILPCALIGLLIGFKLQDRIAQETFRRATLVVLVIAGANLIRRALLG